MEQSSSSRTGPFVAPAASGISSVLERNIHALRERRRREQAEASRQEKAAQAITDFAGSMVFVYLHAAIVAVWVAINLGWLPLPRFDPTFVILATAASVEAIFISTFVLISQNRQARAADRRADLDLQVNLLAEHEISKLAQLVAAMAEKLGVESDGEVLEAGQQIAPEAVLDELEAGEADGKVGRRTARGLAAAEQSGG